jgi:hypothetical protein
MFCDQIGAFLKKQCNDPIFAEFSSVLRKNGNFFADFFGEKKIITSVPGHQLAVGSQISHQVVQICCGVFNLKKRNIS